MTIAPTIAHATRLAGGRVSAGTAATAAPDAGAGNGVAGAWAANPSATSAHVAFAGAN
jgi:hypothetical protein